MFRRFISVGYLVLAASPLRSDETPLTTVRVAAGLRFPVFVTAPPGDLDRLFIVELAGRIRVVDHGELLDLPFLDITDPVLYSGEAGLLGLAFHPDFAANGYFFVHYVDQSRNVVIARYSTAPEPNTADPKSEQIVLPIPHGGNRHYGGWIGFGPNGYLHIAVGDAADGRNAHDLTGNLLGKLLRIDVNGDDFPDEPHRNYAIPSDNPFVGMDGDDEIWDYGLRNPWRGSFDRVTADFYVGDVGASLCEEINIAPRLSTGGVNYGWPCWEGGRWTGWDVCNCEDSTAVAPLDTYSHADGYAIVGGYVYRGSSIPDLQGTYFFADVYSRKIWTFRYDGSGIEDRRLRTAELQPAVGELGNIPSFGEDGRGELYLCTGGEVFKVVPRISSDQQRTPLSDPWDFDLRDDSSILCRDFPAIVGSDPPSGAVDARQPWDVNDSLMSGWRDIELTFDGKTHSVTSSAFCIAQAGGPTPIPGVRSVTALPENRVTLTLKSPLNVCTWTTITHVESASNIRLGYFPGDVNGDGVAATEDFSALIAALEGTMQRPIPSTDMDRSGALTPADLLRWIDFFNRAGSYAALSEGCGIGP